MKIKSLSKPALIIVVGIILAVAAFLLTSVIKVPTVTEQDFHYSVTYKLDGETKIYSGVYTCRFVGVAEGENPLDRYYDGEFSVNGVTDLSRSYLVAQKDGYKLYIITLFNDYYLMGDTTDEDYEPALENPYLEAEDQNGNQYGEEEMPDVFDIEILSWDYPEPIENTFVFGGFSILHVGSMIALLAVGLLVIIACLIFVKKDDSVTYKELDKLSKVLNFVVGIGAIPVISLMVWLLQLTMNVDGFLYQLYLCVPAFIAFTIAASVSLRRKGFTNASLYIQFIGPAIFVLPIAFEAVISMFM